MYQHIELYTKPGEILKKTSEQYCEMTEAEHGFLCGMIRSFVPQKTVEIGVAGGGTTAVIMQCLNEVNPDAKMYSGDINQECYRRKGKSTGYQLEELKEYLPNYKNHTFYLGSVLPQYIERIGNDIDFAILDTTHAMPGEILDFLCLLPYLKENAVVVLHDTALNLTRSEKSFATKILLDTVTGEKYYNYKERILNIAAFRAVKETFDHAADVFSALSVSWAYLPPLSELLLYRDWYKKFYDAECLELFDIFLEAQYNRILQQKK